MAIIGDDISDEQALELLGSALAAAPSARRQRIAEKFFLAALGSIPWVGGFISAAASVCADEANEHRNGLQTRWLEEHAEKLKELQLALAKVVARFNDFGEDVQARLESEEYLRLVRKAFRAWDQADTQDKRLAIGNLISNAAGTRLCSDDVIRLFLDWLTVFHESHLAVIRAIYKQGGITRLEIWESTYGVLPREDSAEADLFKMLIRDLSTGNVIRQARDTDAHGRFLKKPRGRTRGQISMTTTMKSAFDDTDQYVLTELGSQFVHYAMTEETRRVGGGSGAT
jgi:hypothetical protein